ncbi:MAG: phosphocholine cytidylyltransferase family protein [Oscillospiraceae bacterium]|nr:phosphocholine cytidylyltransferase family protein [Oscillospiraceae bacterium]
MDFDGIGNVAKKQTVNKALILAAGLGSRLAPITDNCPKSLVPVNGKPILFKQIENLHENGITEITIISGYKAEILENAVHDKWPEINIICSADYATTNNMYSAYLGRTAVEGEAFLMMNADVFYDASVIKALLSSDASNAIVTDIGRYLEESMKVIEESGRLVKISKAITQEEALGASIDVYKFSAEGGKAFFDKCREYIEENKELKMWSEVALNDILPSVEFKACPLVGRWLEIDNHDDLAEAEKLFS